MTLYFNLLALLLNILLYLPELQDNLPFQDSLAYRSKFENEDSPVD